MKSNRWQNVAFAASLVLLAVAVADIVFDADWPSGILPGVRVLVVAAAALFAGATYVHWESAKARVPATHGTVALGMLGGALVVASVFSNGPDVIFRDTLLATIGVVAIALSYVLGQRSIVAQEDKP